MTRARAALLIASVVPLFMLAPNSNAGSVSQARAPARVMLFVVDGVSFEELLSVPEISTLARAGGAGLLSTNERYRGDAEKVYEALGSGTSPDPDLRGLLARTLCAHGATVSSELFPDTARPSKLLASEMAALLGDPCSRSVGQGFQVKWVLSAESSEAATSAGTRGEMLARVGRVISDEIDVFRFGATLVIVVSPTGSRDMARRGDEVTPIVMARAEPDRLPRPSGPMHALTSGTTRQTGLVANVDVAATILDFHDIPIPAEMDGQPIEITDDPAPFNLHRRHLEQRRIRLPVQLAEVSFVSASGAVAIVVLLLGSRRGSLPPWLVSAMRFLTLCVAALPIPLILGGVLPRLTYAVVVPFIVLSALGLAALAGSARWSGPVRPFVFLGMVGLAVVVVDGLFGWRGARIPLLGGTMFEGARFFGLPNAFLGLLLASALFVATVLPPFIGFLVLVGAGLFAGFPSLGADVGGAATVLFAAGLWWVLRTRRRFGVKEAAFVAGVVALGVGAILLANRYLPGTPTHATRFVETTGNNLGDAVRAYADRLTVGFDQLSDDPAAWIPLLGLPVILALVLARPGPVGWGLELAGRRWMQVLVVLTLAGFVAFFANDTGLAAAAPVFLYAYSGMAYPAFLAAAERRGTDVPVESPRE